MKAARVAAGGFPPASVANYSLFALLCAYILSFVDRQILSLLVGPIRADLGISDFQFSLLQGFAFALFYTLFGIPIARWADHGQRARIIVAGILVWSLMTVLCGFATSFLLLFIARIGVGIGEAALSPPAYSLLSDSFPPERLARATSIFTMGITLGGGMAYMLGGLLIEMVSSAPRLSLPVVGEMAPWQLAFVVVGLPGAVIAVMVATIREPPRQGMASVAGVGARMSLGDAMAFMRDGWRVFAAIFSASALLAMVGYGVLNWYPALLMRSYGMSVGEAGLSVGAVYLVCGTGGALLGALLSEKLRAAGRRDANLRVVMWVSWALLAPGTLAPLMPTSAWALATAAPLFALLNMHLGVTVAALALIVPNQMRALVGAILLFLNNLLGLGLGTSLVAAATDFAFGDDAAVRYSLAIVAAVLCPLAALAALAGLRPYRATLAVAEGRLARPASNPGF